MASPMSSKMKGQDIRSFFKVKSGPAKEPVADDKKPKAEASTLDVKKAKSETSSVDVKKGKSEASTADVKKAKSGASTADVKKSKTERNTRNDVKKKKSEEDLTSSKKSSREKSEDHNNKRKSGEKASSSKKKETEESASDVKKRKAQEATADAKKRKAEESKSDIKKRKSHESAADVKKQKAEESAAAAATKKLKSEEKDAKKRKAEDDDQDFRTPKKKKEETSKTGVNVTPDEKKRTQAAGYFKYISRGGPKNLGSKVAPVGAKDCLKGLTFVTTGVMDSFEREDIKELVEKYGGRLTGSVSGKTSYLMVGDEPGESKIKKAKDLKVPRITEDEFLELIRKSNPDQPTTTAEESDEEEIRSPSPSPKKVKSPSPKKTQSPKKVKEDVEPEPSFKKPSTPVKNKNSVATTSNTAKTEPIPSSSKTSSTNNVLPPKPIVTGPPSLMWVDKYKPVALKNVVGQTMEKSNANKLLKWLQTWFSHHGSADEKVKAAWPGHRDPEGKTFKAALLSGPPGIGKTTTAHLAVKQVGYDYFEMNASDTRNKNGLHGTVADSLDNRTMFRTGDHKSELTSKHVLIMDEVDGMSGNEDRGGIQELINLIKKSRVPIICICNDRNHQKIRSLANYCFDLRFPKPSNEQIKGMIQSICHKEKLKLPLESVQRLISSTDMDIRQIVNQLELIKASSDGGGNLYNPKKDIKFGPWDVCRKVFSAHEHRGMSFQDKSNLFFQDYSFGPLFVQENYLKWTPKAAKDKYAALDLIKKSAEAIATGDLVDNLIRKSNNWSLLPTQAIFSSLLPGEYMEGDEVSGIEFPRWLGKNSSKGKVSRLLQQLHTHVHLQVSGSLEALNMDYLPYLRRSIVNPLVKGDLDAAGEKMQEYSLLREDLDSVNEISMWPGMKNPMDKLDTKTKSAFTRRVNKEILPYSVIKITKGRGRKGAGGLDDELEGLEEDDEDEGSQSEEEEDGKVDSDAMIKVRTRKVEPKKETKKAEPKKESKKKESTAGPSRKARK